MDKAQLKRPVVEIGKFLRLFREKTGRTQGDVALQAGISTSMLSQIERGAVSPSMETLFDVCTALDCEISELFGRITAKKPVRITRKGKRLSNSNGGVFYEQVIESSDPAHPGEMFILEIKPGKSVGLSGRGHEGVEMGYVLSGEARLVVDRETYQLRQGEGVSFRSHYSHRLENCGTDLLRTLWTVLPPHHDYLGTGLNDIES